MLPSSEFVSSHISYVIYVTNMRYVHNLVNSVTKNILERISSIINSVFVQHPPPQKYLVARENIEDDEEEEELVNEVEAVLQI